jgi:Uma2 family endonuclease
MDAAEQITILANAISEGINYLAYIRSLQAEPPVASADQLLEWRKALDDFQASVKATEEGVAAGVMETSPEMRRAFILCMEDVRAHLATIEPGVRLTSSLFRLVDLAWAELEKTLGMQIPSSPSSGEPPRMSIEEWAAMPEDEPGELVAGRLVEEEMADYEHETVVSFANAVLRGWMVPRGGFVAGSEAKFAVGREQGRKPDLSVYLPDGSIPPRHGPIRVPPDIMIEVIALTALDMRRDRIEKMADYAAFGVRWYWLIDPDSRVLEIFELGNDCRYVRVLAAAEGTITIPGCGDLTLDLDALWDELARLGPTAPEK